MNLNEELRGVFGEDAESDLEAEFTAIVAEGPRDEDGSLIEGVEFVAMVEAMDGKASTFMTVFAGILTQYDVLLMKGETKRGGSGNIYRLGHLLAALHKIEQAIQGLAASDSKETAIKIRAAIDKEFTPGNPGDKLRKVIDAYIEKGTLPKYPISKEVKLQIAAEKAAAKAVKADKLTVGAGKPGQKFSFGNTEITTTLHAMGEAVLDGSIRIVDILDEGKSDPEEDDDSEEDTLDDDAEDADEGEDEDEDEKTEGYGRSYGGDPRWMTAKYAGTADDGTPFKKGDDVLYWPSTKKNMVGAKAKVAWKQFQSEKGDEEGMPYAEAHSGSAASLLEDALREEQDAHHFHDGKSWYVDTGFISASDKALPGFTLKHMGMGEFQLKGPDGTIDFDRMRGKEFPGQVGRSHKLYDDKDGALIKKLMAAMKGKSSESKAEDVEAPEEVIESPMAPAREPSAEDRARLKDNGFQLAKSVSSLQAVIKILEGADKAKGSKIVSAMNLLTAMQNDINGALRDVAKSIGLSSMVREAQETSPALAFSGEEENTVKPGAFKISSKALALYKANLGPDWKPDDALFRAQSNLVNNLSREELIDLFGVDRMDLAQDFIASKPRAAFNKWMLRLAKVSPKLGKVIRSQPDNAALIFYLTVVKVSGRDMADIVLKRYFATETDHPGAAKSKTEELEEALRG